MSEFNKPPGPPDPKNRNADNPPLRGHVNNTPARRGRSPPPPNYPNLGTTGSGIRGAAYNGMLDDLSKTTDEALQWTSHQSPCAAALCILGFLLAVFMCCVIATTTMFMNKTHSAWAQKQDLTLCGLENSLIQDPEAKLYMWWMVSSILLFMFLLFYNFVAWAWYIVMTEQAPMQWLTNWSEKHKKKKIEESKKKKQEHKDGQTQAQQKKYFYETGEYPQAQRKTRGAQR